MDKNNTKNIYLPLCYLKRFFEVNEGPQKIFETP